MIGYNTVVGVGELVLVGTDGGLPPPRAAAEPLDSLAADVTATVDYVDEQVLRELFDGRGNFDCSVVRKEKRWRFPKDRFIEYGPEDEWWGRKYGFGHEEEVQIAFEIAGACVTVGE